MNELIDFSTLQDVLQSLAKDVGEGYKEELARNGRKTREQTLINSVKAEMRVNGTDYEVVLSLKDYWKYVENDTKPHWPPYDPDKKTFPNILRWIQIKPIIPRPDVNGRIPTEKQLAFLISRKIAEEGTKGSHDLEKTKDAIIPFYVDRIAQALRTDVSAYIARVLTQGDIKW